MTISTILTDWRARNSVLPDVPPGEEYTRVITPQKHVVLLKIFVRDLTLFRLQIGAVELSFEPVSTGGSLRTYKPCVPRQLQRHAGGITVVAGLDVRAHLRNETHVSAKPFAALLVCEEEVL